MLSLHRDVSIFMNILITNLFIKNFSGSEINVLELVRNFLSRKYTVTVYTYERDEPLIQYFHALKCLVITDVFEIQNKTFDNLLENSMF